MSGNRTRWPQNKTVLSNPRIVRNGPCVFVPMMFGNVRDRLLRDIYAGMRRRFPTEDNCFINRNNKLYRPLADRLPVVCKDSLKLGEAVRFGLLAGFFRLHSR